MDDEPKPVRWVGSSRKDLRAFPPLRCGAMSARHSLCRAVRRGVSGSESAERVSLAAPSLRSWRPARAAHIAPLYTVRFRDAIYVLHSFQKKSKKGIATPRKEIDLIRERLGAAEQDYRERQN
jgi:phage-related protein